MSKKHIPQDLVTRSVTTAQFLAQTSRDPSSRHGLFFWTVEGSVNNSPVIRILSEGFNNFPKGVKNSKKRWQTRALKYDLVVHAEEHAIAEAARTGTKLKGSILTMVGFPCLPCASMVVEAGAKTVVFDASKMDAGYFDRWRDDFIKTKALLDRKKITLHAVGATPALDELFAAQPERLRETWHKTHPVSAYLRPPHESALNSYVTESHKIMDIVKIAEETRAQSPSFIDKDACVLFDERSGAVWVTAYNRPVLGITAVDFKNECDFEAAIIPAARLAVAHAARDGVKLDGLSAYMTRHPNAREVGMLITAGIKNIIVDDRELEMDLSFPERLDSYTKARIMLHEAGVSLGFLTGLNGPSILTRAIKFPDLKI